MMKYFERLWTIMGDCQKGFRPGISTQDAIMIVKLKLDTIPGNERHKWTIIKLDIAKAYDRVDRRKLLVLLQRDLPRSIRNVYRQLLTGTKVRLEKAEFTTKTGVPQGSVLSPVAFAYYLDDAVKEVY